MELPSNGTSFHDASLQTRARIGSSRDVGKWEEPVAGREEVSWKKQPTIGCSSLRYGPHSSDSGSPAPYLELVLQRLCGPFADEIV